MSEPQQSSYNYEDMLPEMPISDGIPKIIMQTCRSFDELPLEIKDNIINIKQLHPDWDYKLYDNEAIEQFIEKEYGATILNYYLRISPEYGAARADLFRYLYIYKMGGVYIDIKSTITKALDISLLPTDSFIFSYWDNLEGEPHFGVGHYTDLFKDYPRGEIPQWFIIASQGNCIIRKVIIQVLMNIDNYNPYVNGVGWTGTVYTTGPVPYTLTLYHNLNNRNHRVVNIFKDFGFVYSIYESVEEDKTYHAKALRSDYRKNSCPVIVSKSHILNTINSAYLKVINRIKR